MAEKPIEYMSGADLLARVRQDRAAFAGLWDGLTDAQLTQRPGVQDDWSVKDLMAHIVWWENYMIERIGKIVAGTDKPAQGDLDQTNAEILAGNNKRELADVVADFDNNLRQVETLITSLTDEQINDPAAVDYGGRQLLKFLISDTFGHYGTHQPDLERYVNSLDS